MSNRPSPLRRRFVQGTLAALTLATPLLMPVIAAAQDKVLHLYSARHYPGDEVIYDTFTRTTGIAIKRVDSDDAGIVARLRAEGAASPADVVLLVDAARLYRGEVDGLFQPIHSKLLEDAIPSNLRAQPTAEDSDPTPNLSTH